MNRAGVALGAVTAAREEAIKKAVERYPGRLIPLTTSATPNDWMQGLTAGPILSSMKRQTRRAAHSGSGRSSGGLILPIKRR